VRVNRLKETYQPNMLIGQVVTIVFCAALALYIKFSDRSDNQEFTFSVNGRVRTVTSWDLQELRPPGTNSEQPLSTAALVSSPLGIGVRLQPKRGDVLPTQPRVPYMSFSDDNPVPDPDYLSFSPPGSGSGLLVSGYSDDTSSSEAHVKRVMTGLVRVLYQEEPEYPPAALRGTVEGEVEVLVYVDSTGRTAVFPRTDDNGLTHWVTSYVVSEDPCDWYFAEAVLKALPRWRFMPRIESGRPIGSYLIIRHWFCISASCRRYEIRQVPIDSSH
jgi:hypothetical protein